MHPIQLARQRQVNFRAFGYRTETSIERCPIGLAKPKAQKNTQDGSMGCLPRSTQKRMHGMHKASLMPFANYPYKFNDRTEIVISRSTGPRLISPCAPV